MTNSTNLSLPKPRLRNREVKKNAPEEERLFELWASLSDAMLLWREAACLHLWGNGYDHAYEYFFLPKDIAVESPYMVESLSFSSSEFIFVIGIRTNSCTLILLSLMNNNAPKNAVSYYVEIPKRTLFDFECASPILAIFPFCDHQC